MKTQFLTLTPRLDSAATWLLILLLLVLVSCIPAFAQAIDKSDTCEVFVTRVVDGDTFFCEKYGDTTKVPILGFDAYESRNGDRLDKQAARAGISVERALNLGTKAKQYAKELIEGQALVLHRGNKRAPNRDLYGRLLRYVIVNDENFAQIMIRRGYAAPSKR
jgi:micrococcal nuclease